MAPKISSEDVILRLINFVSETGRLPRPDEEGLADLLSEATKHFGSLENALRISGLISSKARKKRHVRRKEHFAARTETKSSFWSRYPANYFLNLLDFYSASYYGFMFSFKTPTWWERRANAEYECSACGRTIEKGERYIGRKYFTQVCVVSMDTEVRTPQITTT